MTEDSKTKATALRTMVDKLDNRPAGRNGYVTYLPELKEILNELSNYVPVGIHLDQYGTEGDTVSVTVKLGFALERSLL